MTLWPDMRLLLPSPAGCLCWLTVAGLVLFCVLNPWYAGVLLVSGLLLLVPELFKQRLSPVGDVLVTLGVFFIVIALTLGAWQFCIYLATT